MGGPLAGCRVIELARILAGPWAGQTLADLGAEVIKIERPGAGDDTRDWGPPFVTDREGDAVPGMSAYFLAANRGKRSVTIDFTRPEGQALVRRLVADGDALIENFKVGGLAKYGLDYAALHELNPRLVYCSITGFGQDGPYAKRAGYDFMIQGMGGLMSVTGAPDGEPMKVGVALVDVISGLYAATGIAAALVDARATGRGRHLDIALLDSEVAALANQALNFLVSGSAPGRMGNAHPNIVPYQAFATADGHIILAVGNDAQFARVCAIAGHPELAADPRYATNPARVANRADLVARLAAILATRPSGQWLAAFEAAGVPAGPINSVAEAFADPQVVARGLRLDMETADGRTVPGVASPLRFAGEPRPAATAPPRLGADTDAVLAELGLNPGEIAALRRDGVV